MIFDKEMKYKVGDRLVLHSGKTVLVQKVDARHGEYHVLNADDEEDFEIIKEREVVVNLGGYDNVMEMAVNENIEEAQKEQEAEELAVAETPAADEDDDEDEEEVARLKALYNQLEEEAQKNAEKAKNIVEDATKEADLIAGVVAADEELLRAEKEVAEAEAAMAELELAMLDPELSVDEALESLDKEMAEAEEAVAVLNVEKPEEKAEEVAEEPVEVVEEKTVEEEPIIEEIILSEVGSEEPVEEKVEETVEPEPVAEAEPEVAVDPEAERIAALHELYNSIPQVKCESLPGLSLKEDKLLRYSGWKEKSYAYGKGRRKKSLMKGWKQS